MRIALFANDQVGLRVARFLGACGNPPACLVLDADDRQGLNAEIQKAARVPESETILTNRPLRGRLAEQLEVFEPELCVLAWWPYILKSDVLAVPRIGCLNFHPSLLPHGRGKAPNFWSLVKRAPFGVTIHWVDDGIDSGDIAFQREIPVSWEDTGKTLYNKSRDALVELFEEHWPDIRAGNISRTSQTEQTICHFQRELEDVSRIDLEGSYTGRDLLNLLRARTFEPHPGAWFEDHGRRYEIRISISQIEDRTIESQTIQRA
jgi:methionyl-tRNA formyltransferase